MKKIVSSYSRYIVPPRTNGLTRSPPGVATAEKIAMPRMTIRRDDAQPLRGDDPDPRQRDEQDRELHDQPEGEEHRRHEVEVLAGGGRQSRGPSPSKLNRKLIANGQHDVGDVDAEREEEQRHGTHGRMVLRSDGVRPGEMNAQTWYSRTGIARMIPRPARA